MRGYFLSQHCFQSKDPWSRRRKSWKEKVRRTASTRCNNSFKSLIVSHARRVRPICWKKRRLASEWGVGGVKEASLAYFSWKKRRRAGQKNTKYRTFGKRGISSLGINPRIYLLVFHPGWKRSHNWNVSRAKWTVRAVLHWIFHWWNSEQRIFNFRPDVVKQNSSSCGKI